MEQIREQVTSDTQVIVLSSGNASQKKTLAATLKAAGAPEAVSGSFKRLKTYTAEKLKSWEGSTKYHTWLVTQFRKYGDGQVMWYTDPSREVLRSSMLQMLTSAATDAADPRVRGTEGVDQYGAEILSLKAADTGEVTQVPQSTLLADTLEAFGEVIVPQIADAPQLNARGFLEEGSFHYVDEDAGVWYYVDSELSVTITKHIRTGDNRLVWYEADIIRAEDAEPHLHVVRGDYNSKKAFAASTLAQGWIFAMNGDYHHGRKSGKGLIIRNGVVEESSQLGSIMAKTLPNLDTLLLKTDGTFSTRPASVLTAQDALDMGACDVLSFGPLFVTQGRWRQLNFLYHSGREPRMAIGQLAPNHYLVIFAEGRLKSSLGISLAELQQLFILRGCDEAINLDGGGTACMFFMGQSVGGVGSNWGTTYREPRGQWEMLTIGTMAQ